MLPSSGNGDLGRDARSLRRLTAGLVECSVRFDFKRWQQIERGLLSVLGHFPENEIIAGTFQWTSSSAGEAALECMQAIVEHAPAAMRTVRSLRQGQQEDSLGILVVPHAVCRVLSQFSINPVQPDTPLTAAWPTGLQSCVLALVKVIMLLPQTELYDPVVSRGVMAACCHLSAGRVDLPLKERVDLILAQVCEMKSLRTEVGTTVPIL